MKQTKPWNIISVVIWIVQLMAELLAAATLLRLDMLPLQYFVLLIVLFLLMSVLTGVLLFLPGKKTGAKPGYARRIIAIILAAAMVIGCAVTSSVASKLHQTVTAITEPTTVSSVVAVYVLTDDPAQTLEDASGYSFAITDSYDAENTQKAVAEIQEELGRELTTVPYDSVLDMVDALYDQSVGAMILNDAYADILEDIEEYADFSSKTRVLYEVSIVEQAEVPEDSSAETDSTSDLSDISATAITTTPFVLYLSGSDTRSQMLKTSRSDVNILVVVNPETKQVLLVNTPRDYYVPNPAGNGALDKLTHCGVYGIQCSIDALSSLYQVPVDYYAQINFTGFETLIDAIGGITVYSDVAFTMINGGNYSIQEGYNYLNGSQALGFARERYALAGGDNDRGKNQMKVIAAVIDKMSTGTIITKYSSILDSLQGMFITDISSEMISQLVKMQIADMAKWNVVSYAVTGSNGSNITYSMPGRNLYVMYPNQDTVEHATSLINRVLAGETLTEEDVAP